MSPRITPHTHQADSSLEQAVQHFLADLPEQTARHIRLASGIDNPAVRRAYAESPRVPALLLDTRARFELDGQLQAFVDRLDEAPAGAREVSHLHWQLQLSCLELIWPATCVLQVYDPPETVAAEYGPDRSPGLPRIRIARARLLGGSLWRDVLEQLDPAQAERLLDGQHLGSDARLVALRHRIRPLLHSHRQELFDSFHALAQRSDEPLVNLLRQQLPLLSKSAAVELLASADASDLEALRLSAGELGESPLRDARWYLQEQRLGQAYEGLFLASRAHHRDSLRLMMHSLASWPGGSAGGVRLELRERTADGPLLAAIGEPQARQRAVILRQADHFTLATSEDTQPKPQPDLPSALANLPAPLREALGLTDRETIRDLLQRAALPRDHLRTLLEIPAIPPPQRLPDSNGFQQQPPAAFVSPDQLAQRQRALFDTLVATNARTLVLARQQPNFRWFAALMLGRQLVQDYPQAASTNPDAIYLNTYEQTGYRPVSTLDEPGEPVLYRAVTQSRTLTELFTQHLAGNIQTLDATRSGLYARATDSDDNQQLPGLDVTRLASTLEQAGKDFDQQFAARLDSFWSSAATLLKENLRTQIRQEALLRELDLTLDESNRQDLERVLDHPTSAQRLKASPVAPPVHVYRIILQPGNTALEGCLVISSSPDEETYKLPALLYQIGRGLEQFTTLQALTRSLTQRFDDETERQSLLDLLPKRQQALNIPQTSGGTSLFSYRLETGDALQVLVDGLLARQKLDFADTWRFARGAPGLNNDVDEFARQFNESVNLAKSLDIFPVLARRNRELLFGELLERIGRLSAQEQNRLATLWRPTLKASPVPASLGDLPALRHYATRLLKTHLQQHYPQAAIDPDAVEVQVTHTQTYPSPAWQSLPSTVTSRRRSLSLTALALENIPGSRLGENVTFKARVRTLAGTTLNLSNREIAAIIRTVDAPGQYKVLLQDRLLGKDQASLRGEWIAGERARLQLHAYVAHLSGDLFDATNTPLQRGLRRIEHLLQHPSARKRPLLDGHEVHANYLMLGGTGEARNGMSLDEVLVISTSAADTSLLLLAPQAPDGKAVRELSNLAALESLLREKGWKEYCLARAARNEQWEPRQLFARQFPRVRYFPIEGDLFSTLFDARVRHVIASVEYFGASNQRVDQDTLWYWINAGLHLAAEVILGLAPLQLSLPAYLLRGLYGLGNVSQALALQQYQEAADALIQTLSDAAAPLPLQPLKPLLRQVPSLPTRLSRLIKTTRIGQDGLLQPLLNAEPSAATSLRSLAADLRAHEIRTPPELDYLHDGLFVSRTQRLDEYVQLEGKWYRTGTLAGRRYVLKQKHWAQDIELVRMDGHWRPLPIGRLLGGMDRLPAQVGAARYEIPAAHRQTISTYIDSGARIDPDALGLPMAQREAARQYTHRRQQLVEQANRFFAEGPALPARTAIADLADATSTTQLFDRAYRHQDGIVLGAPHGARAGRKLLVDQMRPLARDHRLKTLYLENLMTDLDQASHLDDFNRTGFMSPVFREKLRHLDILEGIDPQGQQSLFTLLRHAHENGIRVQAIDCVASYRLGINQSNPNRTRPLKYYASQVINADQLQHGGGRWLALVQDIHAATLKGEPGLADLLGAVSLRATDTGGQPLPLQILRDTGDSTLNRFGQLWFLRAHALLEVNVSPQPLPVVPKPHRALMRARGDFLIEQHGGQYHAVWLSRRFSDPGMPQPLVVHEQPIRQSQRISRSGRTYVAFHMEDPSGLLRTELGRLIGTDYASLADLVWGLKQAGLRQVVELDDLAIFLRQPVLDTHPQLTNAGMFTIEAAPRGSVLISRATDRSLKATPIKTPAETGKFYIHQPRWGFSEARLFDSIDDLSQALVRERGMVRWVESSDL
ncbi:membrane-targeted effector domain-containing toxin [Pseudomonas vanderleydeniana]|uniref:Membrane-targeted effector domain-containing toxin n=1 Tax=Pseudomonas vanderleydeniana TaxID=2745495 RepID=A0A9E6PRT8_9PSED|nr:membrane-targeted effector domain-containing toxin [Pseudomonas vanderleydeniana]QXI30856.1 membrane-targeted effector domain-containing toxin [Pseudomonas vanderleydeniana]